MSDNQWDKDEKDLALSLEKDEWRSVGNLEDQKVRFKNMAKKSMAKTKRITLRVTEQDYELAHVKALKEGLPYQTLISSVIHRYLTGQFRDVAP